MNMEKLELTGHETLVVIEIIVHRDRDEAYACLERSHGVSKFDACWSLDNILNRHAADQMEHALPSEDGRANRNTT